MFLKSLTLKGFKSFADATTMDLEPGVTVVVGPNGSGKSNVVDAIAWVLGAQAPKSVRSQKMDDVIFAGTAKRPALGRAEVSLTLDNSAGLLPVEFTEVTVTRVLFRTGESEYAINGVSCRLLDVQELLSDAGVGRQQHVIVSQGQIDAVLNARPEERRAIVEEAAGVLKFRKRKEKAQRRLDSTEANLLRLQDLLREVRRQLRPLERQAQAAQRHGELQGELDALRLYVAGRDIAALRARTTAVEAERASATAAVEQARTALAGVDAATVSLEARLAAHGAADVRDRLRRVEQLRERARGLAGIIAERARGLERERSNLMDEGLVATLTDDAAGFAAELAEVAASLEALDPERAQLEVAEHEFSAERTLFDDADDVGSTAASAAAEVRGELRTVRTGLERLRGDRSRQLDRLAALEQQLAEVLASIESHREACAQASSQEEPLVAELTAAERRRIDAAAELDRCQAQQQRAAEERSRTAARVEALQLALDEAHARAGAERLAGLEGVVGTLVDVMEVDPGWEPAVEAALGEALNAVVVDSPTTARAALELLRTGSATGAVLAGGGGEVPAPRAPGASVPVIDHVRSGNDAVSALLSQLLSDAVCVDDLDSAIDLALSDPSVVVVTRTGDRLGRRGWRIGASGSGATAAALDVAQRADTAAEAALADADAVLASAREAVAAATAAEMEVGARLDHHDGVFTSASEALAGAQARRREIDNDLESTRDVVAELNDRIGAEEAKVGSLEAVLPDLETDEAAEVEAARRRREAREAVDATAAVLASRRRDLEVRTAGLNERREFLERRLRETEDRLAADREARENAEQRRVVVERRRVAVSRLAAVVDERIEVLEELHSQLDDVRRRQSDEVRSLTAELDAARRSRGEHEKALEVARERVQKADLETGEVAVRLETAVEALRRDLDTEPEIAEATEPPDIPDGATHRGRVRELERELRLLGPINPLALEEFNELQGRHEFLEGQLDDVRSTRRELNRVIAAIDTEIQTVFQSAYADVDRNFTELFSSLFPGGRGTLKLTSPDDLLNTGIEVEAKPSGKNVKKLSLLSGGERSLTALAFLFAVFRSRPSPFYVMDEVEAALDDVNLHRFLNLVQEFRRDAQLLIVSHQKRTMEAGDALLGVSMQPGGSSRVVTERVTTASSTE